MAVQRLETRLRGPGAAVLAICLAVWFCAPVFAGPVGAVGDVYAADGDVGGVFQFDGLTGAPVVKFAARGARTFMGQAWGADGNLYAVDNASPTSWSVDEFDGNTGVRIRTVVNYNNASAASVGKGLTFGPDGDMYVGDWFNARVDRYQGTTGSLKASYHGVSGDGLGTPNYMTFAPNGRLMVVSGGWSRVLQFDTSGNNLNLLGTFADLAGSVQPQDLAFGPNGNLFVTTGGVREYDGTTGAFVRDFIPYDPAKYFIGMAFDNHGRLLLSTAGTDPSAYGVVAYNATSGALLGDFFPPGSGGSSSPITLSIKTPEPASLTLLLAVGLLLRRR